MREAVTAMGALVAVIIGFTLLSGGRITLGTSSAGPYANLGFTGPQYRA